MDECVELLKIINAGIAELESVQKSDPQRFLRVVGKIDALVAELQTSNIDYVLCALTKQKTTTQSFFVAQDALRLRVGALPGYEMTNVTNEHRSMLCSDADAKAKIAAVATADAVAVAGDEVVFDAVATVSFDQHVSLAQAFVELVFDEFRSFNGTVVCATLRSGASIVIVDASAEFSLTLGVAIFHCWKCRANFKGRFERAALSNGTHHAVPNTHSSVSSLSVSANGVNIAYDAMPRIAFALRPFNFEPALSPVAGSKALLELRYFIAKNDNESLDYVMTDAQLREMEERKCLGTRASPLARMYFGDFYRLMHPSNQKSWENVLVQKAVTGEKKHQKRPSPSAQSAGTKKTKLNAQKKTKTKHKKKKAKTTDEDGEKSKSKIVKKKESFNLVNLKDLLDKNL